MEIWDAYYPDGTLAGCNLVRGKPIPDGLYHLVSEILVRHIDGDYLLMQRDPRKPNYGGFFEATAGGSALKGEDAYCCAKRELHEETSIDTNSVHLKYLLIDKNNGDRFYSLPVQSPGQLHERTERRWDNLLKSNAANERGG